MEGHGGGWAASFSLSFSLGPFLFSTSSDSAPLMYLGVAPREPHSFAGGSPPRLCRQEPLGRRWLGCSCCWDPGRSTTEAQKCCGHLSSHSLAVASSELGSWQ